MTIDQVETGAFHREWAEWHRRHEALRADPHGFLAVTGLHWLSASPRRFPDAPGEWHTGPEGVVVTLDEGEELLVDGTPVTGSHRFGVLAERTEVTAAAGAALLEVARRGGRDLLRPRHPEHPLRVGYPGTPAYPPLRSWVVPGRYLPFPEPRPTTVGAAVAGLSHVYEAPGRVEFTLGEQSLSLTAFTGRTPGSLSVLFTDATSGVTTYPASRFLHIEPPGPEGRVVLDFNRAVNLPCAYTEYATCPLPPRENRLPVAVTAGELNPHERG